MTLQRVLVIVNKWWECEAVMAAVLNHNVFKPSKPRWPVVLKHPRPRPDPANLPPENPNPEPRAIFKAETATLEIWCISDLIEHLPDIPEKQSSTQVKAQYLPRIYRGDPPALVIAVGTAGRPGYWSDNGAVVVGTNVFMHNYHPNGTNPNSNWKYDQFDQLIPSSYLRVKFDILKQCLASVPKPLTDRFFYPPLNPIPAAKLILEHEAVALGSINVTDYNEYEQADIVALYAYRNSGCPYSIGSLETTHGLIAVQRHAPFLFISGITDRVGYFAQEVTPREYAQNTCAAHNAGVVVSRLIDVIDQCL